MILAYVINYKVNTVQFLSNRTEEHSLINVRGSLLGPILKKLRNNFKQRLGKSTSGFHL